MSYDKYHIDRCEALEFLHNEVGFWPDCVPSGGSSKHIGEAVFNDWRFLDPLDGEIIFANFVSQPILRRDFEEYAAKYAFY